MQDLLSQAILAWTRQKALMTRGQVTTLCSMGLLLGLLMSFGVSAITAPAAGSFAYDLYDVAVNDIVKGAPGFVGGGFWCGLLGNKIQHRLENSHRRHISINHDY